MQNVVLVAENKKEKEILKRALEQSGHGVAMSGSSYVDYTNAVNNRPDIVLVELPREYAGQIRYVQLLRKNPMTCKIPVIGYGNHKDKITWQGFITYGVTAYLARPLKMAELLGKIDGLVGGRKKSNQAGA